MYGPAFEFLTVEIDATCESKVSFLSKVRLANIAVATAAWSAMEVRKTRADTAMALVIQSRDASSCQVGLLSWANHINEMKPIEAIIPTELMAREMVQNQPSFAVMVC